MCLRPRDSISSDNFVRKIGRIRLISDTRIRVSGTFSPTKSAAVERVRGKKGWDGRNRHVDRVIGRELSEGQEVAP